MFSRFDTILDGRTDRQTDGRTEMLQQYHALHSFTRKNARRLVKTAE